MTIGVGVVGYGYWGPKLVRNFERVGQTSIAAVCEPNEKSRQRADAEGYFAVSDIDELLALESVQAVAIATPVETHFPLAKAALLAGRHVFCEKPFTRTTAQAAELLSLARERGLVIMVDHTFLYTAAVRKLRELVTSGSLGDLLYYDSVRVNLGLFQPDVDVIWDLAPHDLSILDHLVGKKAQAMSAIGSSHSPSGLADVAYITIDFGNELLAHLHVNWLAPKKIRQVLIGGTKNMFVWDDMEPDEKIRVYDRGIEIEQGTAGSVTLDHGAGKYQHIVNYRMGDAWAPWLDRTEALYGECVAFADAIENGTATINDGTAGLRVVHMLEAASASLKERGRFIELDWDRYDVP